MKNILIKITGLVASGMLIFSCSGKYLEFEQHGVLPEDETYANADDAIAQSLIAGVYVDVKYLMMGDWGIHFIATTTAKVADSWPGGSGPSDGADYQAMARFTDNSETGAYKDMYQRLYRIMRRCNMIVEKLNGESAERQRVIGEAKAWRAWAMMHLTQLWGSAPLVSHTLDGIDYSFTPGNTSPEESWTWIMQQFDEAAEVLPSKAALGGQAAIGGRWTKEACYAYKGKGYMWQNDYANAKVELAKVIDSGKYDLWKGTATMGPSSYGTNTMTYKSEMDASNAEYNASLEPGASARAWIDGSEDYVYSTVFRAEADFCDEFLLELDISGDATTITNTEPYWFRAYMNWRYDQFFAPGNTSSRNDGWGFILPTRTFGLAFCKHDGNSLRRRATIATFDEVYRMFPYGNADIRGVAGSTGYFSCEGYFRMKYYDFLDDTESGRYESGQTHGNTTNFPLMRYSNVLLLYAEACCMDGEGPASISGLEALNMVRRRAGLTDAPALDMDNEEYGIKAERRFELYLEDCDRYVDLIRWGDYREFITNTSEDGVGEHWAVDVPWFHGFIDPDKVTTDPTDLSNYDVTYDAQSRRGNWDDKLYLLPFPYDEITMNPSLTQNPGW